MGTFEKSHFDTHFTGWVTLFESGDLIIETEQKVWAADNVGPAINRAVRYSTDGGATYTTMENGQAHNVDFWEKKVQLTVQVQDYSSRSNIHDDCQFIYDVFITTQYYAEASGVCVNVNGTALEGKSEQIPFPTTVQVSEDEAKDACKVIEDLELQADCVTDVRMVNDPSITAKLVTGFKNVETTEKGLPRETRRCHSVGDPHVKRFDGSEFDAHKVGWKVLYEKDDLIIELEQVKAKIPAKYEIPSGPAVNRAMRYSTNGGTSWDETFENGKTFPGAETRARGTKHAVKVFNHPSVYVTVDVLDWSLAPWSDYDYVYNVYVMT